MKLVVLFGIGEFAEVVHFYLTHDSDYKIVAFTVDREFMNKDTFLGLPIVKFEDLKQFFPPSNFEIFIAIGYSGLNKYRIQKYNMIKQMGYHCISYISSKSVVWPDLKIGENCLVMESSTIQPFVTIGNNVIIGCSNLISHHVIVNDNCYIAAQATICGGAAIGDNCFIGANATIREHIKVASNNIIGAGSLILKNTIENGVYSQNSTVPLAKTSDKLLYML